MKTLERGGIVNIVTLPDDVPAERLDSRIDIDTARKAGIAALAKIYGTLVARTPQSNVGLESALQHNLKGSRLFTQRGDISIGMDGNAWHAFMSKIPGLKGEEQANAAVIMHALSEGIHDAYVYNHDVLGLCQLRRPELYLFRSDTDRVAMAFPSYQAILVDIDWLRSVAANQPGLIIQTKVDNTVLRYGTLLSIAHTLGFEEGDHHGASADPEFAGSTVMTPEEAPSLAAYDASPYEYRWLAHAQHIPRIQESRLVSATLRRRYEAATAYRAAIATTPPYSPAP